MDPTTVRIEQKRCLRGRQSLTLDEDMLTVEFRRGLPLDEYRFDLRGFQPDPVRIKRVPLAKIIASCLLAVVGAVVLMVGATGTVVHVAPVMLAGLLLLTLAAVAWFYIAKDWVDVVMFQGPGGQFVVWPDHHDKEQLKEFLAALSNRIRNAQHPEQGILRQLRLTEIINDWQYDQAMELLEQQGQRAEGP